MIRLMIQVTYKNQVVHGTNTFPSRSANFLNSLFPLPSNHFKNSAQPTNRHATPSPLLRRAAQSRNRPRDDQRVRLGAAADVQERRRVARCWAEAGDGDDVADDGDDHGACDVPATFFQAVAVPGCEHGCHEVWGGCEEGLHGRGAHVDGAHDCWVEVVEAEGAGDADVEGDLGLFVSVVG